MTYCPDCGVEIGDSPVCPLCGAKNPRQAVQPIECAEKPEHDAPYFLADAKTQETFTAQEKRKIVWEVLSVAFLVATIALFSINLLLSGSLTWSLIPVASFIFLWMLSSAILMLDKHRILRSAILFADAPLFLFALSLITGNPAWSLQLAIPLAVFSETALAFLYIMIVRARRKGLNIIAYTLIAIAILCLGIEIFVDLYIHGIIWLGWSAILAIALFPIAAFLMYLHYRVATSTNLHRLFRL
ncbi:MAG: DUF6320 domain-containing protein [Spirochaetia bacterium]|nr:DUF6320 domain-containing protein [Spirochaetia bacterium]